ncbi:hypothetical protein GCM10022213_27240 [Parerythrobacter jejuensis]
MPSGGRGLGAKDFLCIHPFEPVIPRIEFAHMLKAHPAPLARTVKTVAKTSGRAEFARLAAGRVFADSP